MKFSCPHCEQSISADWDVSGQTVECPGCAKPFRVEPWSVSDEESASNPPSSVTHTPRPPDPQLKRRLDERFVNGEIDATEYQRVLHAIQRHPGSSAALESPSRLSNAVGVQRTAISPMHINWIPALVFYCVASAIGSFLELISASGDEESATAAFWVMFPVFALGLVFLGILHYQLWNALPQQFRETTPGKAVGFLFIPFFNFYWAFITWPKLSEGYLRWQQNFGMEAVNTQGLAITYAVLFVTGLVFSFIPDLSILIGIADLVIFIIYYRAITNIANRMLSMQR